MALINCPNCGGKISDKSKVCPKCGYSRNIIERCPECGEIISDNMEDCSKCGYPIKEREKVCVEGTSFKESSNEISQEVEKPVEVMEETKTQMPEKVAYIGQMKENRNFLILIALNIVTLGVYSIYFYATVVRDVNHVCKEDGQQIPGLTKIILLSLVTLGIYGIYWTYKVCERTKGYCEAHLEETNLELKECISGDAYLCWGIFGSLLLGAGAVYATCCQLRNLNNMCKIYNVLHVDSEEKIPKCNMVPVYVFGGLSVLWFIVVIVLSSILSILDENNYDLSSISYDEEKEIIEQTDSEQEQARSKSRGKFENPNLTTSEKIFDGFWYPCSGEGTEDYEPYLYIDTVNDRFYFEGNMYSDMYGFEGPVYCKKSDNTYYAKCKVENPPYGYNCDEIEEIQLIYIEGYEMVEVYFIDKNGDSIEAAGMTQNGECFYKYEPYTGYMSDYDTVLLKGQLQKNVEDAYGTLYLYSETPFLVDGLDYGNYTSIQVFPNDEYDKAYNYEDVFVQGNIFDYRGGGTLTVDCADIILR